jgi:hypothetical protein
VIGESYCHLIPDWWLPSKLKSVDARAKAGKWSTVILAVAIVLVVPIGIIKDVIGDSIVVGIGGKIERVSCRQSQTGHRHFTKEQRTSLVMDLRPFSGIVANVWIFSGGSPEKLRFAVDLYRTLKDAGWITNGVSTRMIGSSMATGFVVIRQRESDDSRISSAAKTLTDKLNLDCIDADLSSVRFSDNGEFGQIVFVDDKRQHVAANQQIFGPQPLKNADISLLVGDAL